MPAERLRKRTDFLAAAAGVRARSDAFTVQTRRRDDQGPARVGFTASRKVGNAVERNRARRRLREIVRLSPPEAMSRGHDYVLVARRAALKAGFGRLAHDFEKALRRLSLDAQTRRMTRGNNASAPTAGSDESGQ